jgi:hypothetical protein
MKIALIYILTGAMILSSCKNNNQYESSSRGDFPYQVNIEKSINNLKDVSLSRIGSEPEYIALESKQECMLGEITKIALSDSFIYVSDGKKLLQFKRDGEFVKQIGLVGRGPGEYSSVADFYIDEQRRKIFLLDYKHILVFDIDGLYKRSFYLDFRAIQIIAQDTNTLIFHDVNLYMKIIENSDINLPDTLYSIHITDTSGNNVVKIKHDVRKPNEPYINITSSPLYLFNGTAHFLETGIDTLYKFNKSNREPYAFFNLGKMKMDPRMVDKEKYGKQLKNKLWIVSLVEDNNYFFVDLMQSLSDSISYCLVNKRTSEIAILRSKGLLNDIDEGINFWPRSIYKVSILIDYVDAFKFLDFINKKLEGEPKGIDLSRLNQFRVLKGKLTETSNPVLMILK